MRPSPVVPALQRKIVPQPRLSPRPVITSNTTQQAAQQHAEASPVVGEDSLEEPSTQQDDVWSPDYEPDYEEYGDGTSDQVAIALALKKFQTQAETRNANSLQTMEVERINFKPSLEQSCSRVSW